MNTTNTTKVSIPPFYGCNSQFISPNIMLWPNESVARENSALPGGSALSLSWTGTTTLTMLPSPFLTTTWNLSPLPTPAVTTLVVTTPAANKTPTIDDDGLSTAAIEGIAISAAVAVIIVVGMIILFLVFRKRTRQSTLPINCSDVLEAAEPVELPNP